MVPKRQILNFSLLRFSLAFLSYRSGEKLEATEFMRVMDAGRVDGLGQDQEQSMDGKEEKVKE